MKVEVGTHGRLIEAREPAPALTKLRMTVNVNFTILVIHESTETIWLLFTAAGLIIDVVKFTLEFEFNFHVFTGAILVSWTVQTVLQSVKIDTIIDKTQLEARKVDFVKLGLFAGLALEVQED